MDSSKKFYQSKTVIGLALALVLVIVLPRVGVEIPAEYSNDIWAALAAFIVLGLRDSNSPIKWLPDAKKEEEPSNGAG
tara:strand:+ start:64 stop:297 length:234 start_codon:yes stop_codon:yes gene_type:complete